MKKLIKIFRSIGSRLLSINDKPEKIAFGYALGIFLATTPFIGLKVPIALMITYFCKWSKMASVIGVYHINAFTAPLYYGLSYSAGKSTLGFNCHFVFPHHPDIKLIINCFAGSWDIFLSLLIGGLIIGIPLSIVAYKLLIRALKRRNSIQETNQAGSYALVTGASRGLGREISIQMAKKGYNLLLVSLKNEGLEELSSLIKSTYKVDVKFHETDLADSSSVYQITSWSENYPVSILINNAGIGGTKAFDEATPAYIDNIIQINIRATSLLTRLVLPNLKMQPKAYIMNVASMASFCPIAYKTVYPASKAFIWSFSKSLNQELKGTNVSVSVIHPGPMRTNPDVTKRINKQGFIGKLSLISIEKIAKISINRLFKRHSRVIPGFGNKLNLIMIQLVPLWIRLSVVSNILKRELEENRERIEYS
jgi:uncharacterized protein